MLYGLTESASNAKAPGWYGIEVVMGCGENSGIVISMCEAVVW